MNGERGMGGGERGTESAVLTMIRLFEDPKPKTPGGSNKLCWPSVELGLFISFNRLTQFRSVEL